MVDIWKMKYAGCCNKCLAALGEKDIYRIEYGSFRVEMCKDCLAEFMEELNKKYAELFERKE